MARKHIPYSCTDKKTMSIPSNGKKFPISNICEDPEDWKERKNKVALHINEMDSKEILNKRKGLQFIPVGKNSPPHTHPKHYSEKRKVINPSFQVHAFLEFFVFSKWQLEKLCQYMYQECLR